VRWIGHENQTNVGSVDIRDIRNEI